MKLTQILFGYRRLKTLIDIYRLGVKCETLAWYTDGYRGYVLKTAVVQGKTVYYLCRVTVDGKITDIHNNHVVASIRVSPRMFKRTLRSLNAYPCGCIVHQGAVNTSFRYDCRRAFMYIDEVFMLWKDLLQVWCG